MKQIAQMIEEGLDTERIKQLRDEMEHKYDNPTLTVKEIVAAIEVIKQKESDLFVETLKNLQKSLIEEIENIENQKNQQIEEINISKENVFNSIKAQREMEINQVQKGSSERLTNFIGKINNIYSNKLKNEQNIIDHEVKLTEIMMLSNFIYNPWILFQNNLNKQILNEIHTVKELRRIIEDRDDFRCFSKQFISCSLQLEENYKNSKPLIHQIRELKSIAKKYNHSRLLEILNDFNEHYVLSPVPTSDDLFNQFYQMKSFARKKSFLPLFANTKNPFWEFYSNLLDCISPETKNGNSVRSVLARAEVYVNRGDFKKASNTLSTLDGSVRADIDPWLGKVEDYFILNDLIREISSSLNAVIPENELRKF